VDVERIAKQVEFLVEIDKIKGVFRRTLLIDSSRYENDAEHSWHLALFVLILAEHANEPGLDLLRTVKMVLIHDIVEIDAGDVFLYDTALQAGKAEREAAAAARIFGMLPQEQGEEFRALWEEFEARETPEARFAAAVDRLQPLLHNYRTQGHAWKKHGIRKSMVVEANRHIAAGAEGLWEYARQLIDESVAKGYLADDSDEARDAP
jgi:5'-deoxynucleotidase YfbR-like HD superfamily hydrolase